MVEDLPHVLATPHYQLRQGIWLNLDLLLEADGHHGRLYLFHPGPTEPQVKTVIAETPDLLMVPVITHADHGHLAALD